MAEDKELDAMQIVLQQALDSEQIINLYANGFICVNSNADIIIVLKKNQKPAAVINLSYTTAKTLSEKLTQMIRDFEKTTSNTIMTISTIVGKQKVPKDDKLQ